MFNTNPFIDSDTTMSQAQQKFDNEAKVNTANSIMRIRSDYAQPWVGLLRETIQNSTDGWGFNKQKGNLPQDRDLKIEFFVDTKEEELIIKDNAGGMNYETFSNNLLAIDNPSTDKADGNGAGSYGRGFWVIMSCGKEADLETYHESGMYSSAVNSKGMYKTIQELSKPVIGSGETGTFYHIKEVRDDDMSYLSNWDKIEEVLVENFAPLINDDNVTIEYTIDGVTHRPDAPDLSKLRREYALCDKPELEPFTYHEETFRVKDFVMIDATKMTEEPPWRGIVLFKGNDYLDYPFMKVDDYKSRVVPSMRNPVKMFGWCDASDICRTRENGETLENNAHDEIQLNRVGNKSNIQDEVYRLHDEHFKNNYTTEEKDELFSTIQNNVNSVIDKFDNFSEMSTMSGGIGTGPSKSSSPSSSLSFLRCKTDKVKLDVGEDISLSVDLNPRDELEYEEYEVFDILVKNVTEDEVVHKISSMKVPLRPNKPVEQHLDSITIEKEGKYAFSASVKGCDATDVKDTSKMTFVVGDVEEELTDETEPTDKDSEGSVSFIREINNFAGGDEAGRAFVSEHPNGGLTLHVNTEWPTLLKLQKEERGDAFEYEQQKMFIEWGLDAIVDYWLEEEMQTANTKDEQIDVVRESVTIRENISKEWVLNE